MRIVADSSCDLKVAEFKDFRVVPLNIYTDERNFCDDEDLDVTAMLDYLQAYKGRSYTSCPSIDAWLKAFEGAKEIFVLTVTSALSGSYNSAMNAAQMYKEENSDVKISIIDSLSTGAEEILVLHKLNELIEAGNDFDAIDAGIREYSRKARLFFSFFSLHNLAQNGRINKAIATALNVLNIAITGTASAQGKIDVTGKARGEKRSLNILLQEMEKAGYHGGRAVITHVENSEAAQRLKEIILEHYPGADISIYPAGGLCSYYMERKGIVVSCETE